MCLGLSEVKGFMSACWIINSWHFQAQLSPASPKPSLPPDEHLLLLLMPLMTWFKHLGNTCSHFQCNSTVLSVITDPAVWKGSIVVLIP